MLMIIFTGLAILPLLIICFGGLFLRSFFKPRTLAAAIVLCLLALGIELFRFYQLAHSNIEFRQWIIISDLMALFPIYCSLTVLALGLGIFIAFDRQKLSKPILSLLVFGFFVTLSLRTLVIEPRINQTKADQKMLSEDLTPLEINQIADSGTTKEKIVLATRADLTPEIIKKLISDKNEIIRFYGLVHPSVELSDLNFLKDNDESKEIRHQASIEIKKRNQLQK
jgi:hypothetical protein